MNFNQNTISTKGAFCFANGFSIKQYQKDMSIASDRILEGSRVAKTDEGIIEYSTTGKGSPVLFIHGAGGGHDMGRLIVRRIGDEFLWICPSRFGYLRTPIPQNASFEAQADTYVALLDHLHIEKAAVIGLSIGGPSALLFALRHPERCTALVLMSAVSKTRAKRPLSDWFYNTLFSFDFFYWALSGIAKNTLIRKFGVDPAVLKSLTKEEKKWADVVLDIFHPVSERCPGIRNDQKATISDKQYELERINLPTLILHALDDRLVDYDFARYAHDHIPNSKLVAFSSGGHLLLGQDKQYRKALIDFLKEHLYKKGWALP